MLPCLQGILRGCDKALATGYLVKGSHQRSGRIALDAVLRRSCHQSPKPGFSRYLGGIEIFINCLAGLEYSQSHSFFSLIAVSIRVNSKPGSTSEKPTLHQLSRTVFRGGFWQRRGWLKSRKPSCQPPQTTSERRCVPISTTCPRPSSNRRSPPKSHW